MEKVALAVGLGLVAGVFAGLFGVGGGILFVPTLSLALGLDQLHAQATSLAAMLPSSRSEPGARPATATCACDLRSCSGWRV